MQRLSSQYDDFKSGVEQAIKKVLPEVKKVVENIN